MNSSILFAFALIATAFLAVSADRVRYDNHKVLRIVPSSDVQLAQIETMLFFKDLDLDVWDEPSGVGRSVDIRVHPKNEKSITSFLDSRKIPYSVMVENVQELIDREEELLKLAKPYSGGKVQDDPFYSQYNTYDQINAWVANFSAQYPTLTSVTQVGSSYEGRVIMALQIHSSKPSSKTTPSGAKHALWLDGGIHAREWISTATVVYMAAHIVQEYGTNPNITRLVDEFDWTFPFILNPDGYVYTFTKDRNWRKTRSPNKDSLCYGTDPNRNWNFHWGEAGASTEPCSDSYQGKAAFSEIEISSIANSIQKAGVYVGYINFHSYSQLWMSPWGYTSALPKDYAAQNQGSAIAVAALQAVYGTQYQYGPISTTIYPASGSSADWTYGVCNVTFSYGVELRDTGKYGFLLPADQIVPSGVETLAGVLAWADYIFSVL